MGPTGLTKEAKHSQTQQNKWNLKGEAKQSQSRRESRKQHRKESGQQKMMCPAREKKANGGWQPCA